MEIDTLIFSGGGPSGLAYTGVFEALLDHEIIYRDLRGIREIITTSIGILFSFAIIIGLDNKAIRKIVLEYNTACMLNYEDICVDGLLVDYGIFETNGIRDIFRSILKRVCLVDEMSLSEMYERYRICLTVKVYNVTRKQIEYISHVTHPCMSIVTLAEMTTAIPIMFKPIRYKGDLYVDGGIRGSYPIEHCKSDRYLGVCISGTSKQMFSEIREYLPIAEFLCSLLVEQDQVVYDSELGKTDPRTIFIKVGLGLNFDVDKKQKLSVVQNAYEKAEKHIEGYILHKE
jgi:predicted acylesterase/phospholipase RssA